MVVPIFRGKSRVCEAILLKIMMQASRHEKIIGRARIFFMKLGGRGMGVTWAWRGRARELLVGRSPYLPYLWRDPCTVYT